MACVVIAITISIFNFSQILTSSCTIENLASVTVPFLLKNIIFDIVMTYKNLWLFLKVFLPKYNLTV